MDTFFHNVRQADNTVLVVHAKNDWKFGAFCADKWKMKEYFYGSGETFLFSFNGG
jgi:hypothetical protein